MWLCSGSGLSDPPTATFSGFLVSRRPHRPNTGHIVSSLPPLSQCLNGGWIKCLIIKVCDRGPTVCGSAGKNTLWPKVLRPAKTVNTEISSNHRGKDASVQEIKWFFFVFWKIPSFRFNVFLQL